MQYPLIIPDLDLPDNKENLNSSNFLNHYNEIVSIWINSSELISKKESYQTFYELRQIQILYFVMLNIFFEVGL